MSCTLGFVVSILHRDAAVPGADISASRQAYFTANIRSPAIGIAPIRGLSTDSYGNQAFSPVFPMPFSGSVNELRS
jgi:hypothetical protein